MADRKGKATPQSIPNRGPAVPPASRSVVVPNEEDLEVAKTDALLQLRIGRSSHYYSVVVSLLLLLDGILVLAFQPDLAAIAPGAVKSLFFLFFPLACGLFLAIFGLRVKWEVYQLWPWETHFWLTIGGVILNIALTSLFFLNLFQVTAVASLSLLPWFYPLALLGVSLPMIALAHTWPEWTHRKILSVAAALLPLPFAFVLYLNPLIGSSAGAALAITLFVSAVLYQTSGSFLHFISSGTRAHEREVINSSQSRIFLLAEEVRQKEDSVRFREATLLSREADAEDAESSLLRTRQSLEEGRSQFRELEDDLAVRSDALSKQQQEWTLKSAEVAAQKRAADDKEADIALREADIAARVPRMSQREQSAIEREGELTRREMELAQRDQNVEHRTASLPEMEARLETRRQELEAQTAEVLRREAEVTSRESMVNIGDTDRAAVQDRLIALEERETRLNQLKLILDEQNISLGRRSKQVEDASRALQEQEGGVGQRAEETAKRSLALEQRESEATEKLAIAAQRQRQYEEALRRYEDRATLVERNDAEISTRAGDLTRLGTTLRARETTLKERELRLEAGQSTLDRSQRELLGREKSLAAREDDLNLRESSAGREPDSGADARPGRRTIAPSIPSFPSGDENLVGGFVTRPSVPVRFADRQGTGVPRLDDLLSGGVPPRGHLLLIGPPFIGKELVLYTFIAEGLRRGQPAVIITASHSPEEVSQQVGLISPQFREYERMGRVLWIDASNPAPPASTAVASRIVVKGPEDHSGILSALVQSAMKLEASGTTGFRVGYLGLANSLAHSEPRKSYSFLQNLVAILKPRPAIAMYTVDGGTLPDGQLESVQTRMDGALLFKQERGRTFLSVQGLGEVQTRDWVEYRATNRAVLIGSFSLERIR